MSKKITQTFNLNPNQKAIIQAKAKHAGDSSQSAALRSIINEYTDAGVLVKKYFDGHVTAKEAMQVMGRLLLGQLHPSPPPPGGNGGESETA